MPEVVDINDFVFTAHDQPSEGADVRVRPEPARPTTYGQGEPLPGPKLNGVQFVWGAPLEVSDAPENGVGDPEAGLVHPSAIAQTPELFMSEENYQEYLN